ncbi:MULTISPECIES: glycosyltransferase family 4 protein [unclassified Chryseobacterium]|uniref:glycosyltransferase family 4 protein n=1 Tax=unclassified Chryseobacterium TaxID=2593645 RepID=UPI000E73BB9F|nr:MULTISPECIES: glycosyltransferase [unclassified Chryseobacterium]RKE82878.1 glycosyltransferase involved in cell wall biosynthesis [Chryseobacterium sp. AG363]WNI38697.1 glycosyltransferase [Chryseobacterium sp. SG20098]
MKFVLMGVKSSPKNISGQSICFDMLLDELKKQMIPFKYITVSVDTDSNFQKILEYLTACIKLIYFYITTIGKSKMIYIAVAQSRLGFYRDFMFVWISALFGKKIVAHLHGGNFKTFYLEQSPFLQKIIKKTYDQCDCIIVLSRVYTDLFDFVDNYKEKVKVVPNGIPEFDNDESIEKKYNPTRPVILYLSNLIESKGYLDVLHSSLILKEKYNIFPQVYFCGNFLSNSDDVTFDSVEKAKDYFHNFVKENKLEDNVVYKGLVQGEAKDQILKNADFLILPTNYNAEGQPISLIEGLKNGCVLITTQYRDIQYMNLDKETGFFVNYNDPEAIAEMISNVNEQDFKRMSLNAQKHFKNSYSFISHYNNIIKIFYEYS